MATELKFTEANISKIATALLSTISPENSLRFWRVAEALINRQTQLAFTTEGARAGHSPWPKLSAKTIKTRAGTPRIRYGTDKNPQRTRAQLEEWKSRIGFGWGSRGPMKGYEKDRRYSTNSKALQASGGFRKSFKTLTMTPKGVTYGTEFSGGKSRRKVTAEKIMSVGPRPVLFWMPQDQVAMRNLWFSHVRNIVRKIPI